MTDEPPRERMSAVKVVLIVLAVFALLIFGIGGATVWFVKSFVDEETAKTDKFATGTQLVQIENAIEQFQIEHDKLPESLDELVGPAGMLDSDTVPTDAWDRPFQYVPGQEGDDYELSSFGADGEPGGEGYDADITRESIRSHER